MNNQADKILQEYIEKFDINSLDNSTLTIWYRDYEPDYILYNDLHNWGYVTEEYTKHEIKEPSECKKSCQDMVNELIDTYQMKSEQFRVRKPNHVTIVNISEIPNFWIEGIATLVPHYKHNIDIIDDHMFECGYIRVSTQLKTDNYGRHWYHVIYNPIKQPNIKKMIMNRAWFHYSPDFNHDSIMENGILLSRGNDLYKYPSPRAFLYTSTDGEPDYRFERMMCAHSRKIKEKHHNFDGTFDCYVISHRILDDFEFFWDPNMPDCVYVTKPIPPEAIDAVEDAHFPPY